MGALRGGAGMTRAPGARVAVLAGVLAALAAWTHAQRLDAHDGAPDLERDVPVRLGAWSGQPAPPLDPDVARVLAADQYLHRFYRAGGTWIEMDVAYYSRPRAGAVMHSPLNCLPGNGWQVVDTRTLPVADGFTVRRLVVARGDDRVAMTYWFQNRGAAIANEYRQRVELLANGLRGRPTDAAVVRVMAREDAATNDALVNFTRHLGAVLAASFR